MFDEKIMLHVGSAVATGGFGGLSPPNSNMKHYKLVEFLSNFNFKPPSTNVKPPPHKRKTLIDDGSACG